MLMNSSDVQLAMHFRVELTPSIGAYINNKNLYSKDLNSSVGERSYLNPSIIINGV